MKTCNFCGTPLHRDNFATQHAFQRAKFCSRDCRYTAARRDGAEYVSARGYTLVKVHGHPVATRSGGYMFKHRYVMEQHLGRLLTTEETVHHKDGNKQNNHIDNLELLSNTEHVTLHNKQQILATGVAAINAPQAVAKRMRTRRWSRVAQRLLSVS